MTYRFLMNGQAIDRENEKTAKRFACSIPTETPVLIFDEEKCIETCKVSDIWELPNESYQDRISKKLTKK